MTANPLRIGRFDDDVAAEVGDFAAVVAGAEVLELQRLVERDGFIAEFADRPLLRFPVVLIVGGGGGHDDPIADAPATHGFGKGDRGIARLRRGAELDPGAVQRRAVKVHATATADDRRTGLPVHAFDIHQANRGGMFGRDRLVGRADFESSPVLFGVGGGQVGLTVEALFAVFLAALNFDESNGQTSVLVGSETQGAGHVDRADRGVRLDVVEDSMAGANLDASAGAGDLAALPGGCRRPRAALDGADNRQHRPRAFRGVGLNRIGSCAGQADQQGNTEHLQ